MKTLLTLFIIFIQVIYANNHELKIQVNSKNLYKYIGIYIALEKGFYKDVNLNIKLLDYNENTKVINNVLNGKADIGFSDTEIFSKLENKTPLILLANFYKHSSSVIVTQTKPLNDNSIKLSSNIENIIFKKLLEEINLKIDSKNINNSLEYFITKQIFGIKISKLDELYFLNKLNFDYELYDPTIYDLEYYEQNLFTTKKNLNIYYEEINSFIDATIKGWEYTFNHQLEAVKILNNKYNKENNSIDFLSYQIKEIKKIMLPSRYKIGSIDKQRIKEIILELEKNNFIRNFNLIRINDLMYKPSEYKLTKNELTYLKNKKFLNICNSDNKSSKYVYDKMYNSIDNLYLKKISEKINIPIKYIFTNNENDSFNFLKNSKCDLITKHNKINKNDISNFNLIKYLDDSLIIIGKKDNSFKINIDSYRGNKLGLFKNSLYYNDIKNAYPEIEFILLDNYENAISQLKTGQIQGFIDTYFNYVLNIKDYYDILSVNSKLDMKVHHNLILNKKDKLIYNILKGTSKNLV